MSFTWQNERRKIPISWVLLRAWRLRFNSEEFLIKTPVFYLHISDGSPDVAKYGYWYGVRFSWFLRWPIYEGDMMFRYNYDWTMRFRIRRPPSLRTRDQQPRMKCKKSVDKASKQV
jgi:hypothetical protein